MKSAIRQPRTEFTRRWVWLLFAVALTWLPIETRAQDFDPRADAAAHIGPLYVSPTLLLEDFGFDSNVFNTSGPDTVSDFTFMLTPQVVTAIGRRNALLSDQSRMNLVYFATQAHERSVNHDFAANGHLVLRRLLFTGHGSYVNTRRRLNDEIDTRSKRLEAQGDLTAQLAITRKLGLTAGGRAFSMRFDDAAIFDDTLLSETLNRDSLAENAGVRFALTPLTTVVGLIEIGQDRFTKSPSRDADTRLATVGFDFNRRAVISGAAQVGYERLTPLNSVVPVFSGLVSTINVGIRVREGTQVGVIADRRPGYSYGPEQPYYAYSSLGASLRRQVAARVDIEVSGRRSAINYEATIDPSKPRGSCDCGSQTLWNGSAAVGFTVNRHARWTVGAAYWERHSTPRTDLGFTGLKLGGSVVYKF
jgi:hypothetical protein